MKNLKNLLIITLMSLYGTCTVFAQSKPVNRQQLFVFRPMYSTGKIDLESILLSEIYITCPEGNVDSIMSMLSKERYGSVREIFDALKKYSAVYKIDRIQTNDKALKGSINAMLANSNNFNSGYLFYLKDDLKRSTVPAYLLWCYKSQLNLQFTILKDPCHPGNVPCVIINRLEE